ncbi:MAG: [protein-PII] uridylyltransferase [Halorhodospira sp.]
MATSAHPQGSSLSQVDTALAAGEPLVPALRHSLREADAAFAERFRKGTPAAELVTERAALMDEVVQRLWRTTLGADEPGGCALLAVGGYGRGELHPGSDIDVLVVIAAEYRAPLAAPVERYITSLWDLGLEVGHSVRTIDECIEAAASDITIATNLIESRLLAGSAELYAAIRRLSTTQQIWPSRTFFEAKLAEQQTRHRKFHDNAYNLEPNVKATPGGLRDLQVIGWVAKRHFGAEHLRDLVAEGFLTEAEYQVLHAGQSFLWDVRFGLHLIAGRREDRLLFDHQLALAELFGYTDDNRTLAVEQLMQRYFRTAMEISRLNEMLLQHFEEAILYTDEDTTEPEPVNRRFQIRRGFLEVTEAQVFKRYPFALLEIFLLLEQNPQLKGVRASTIRLIRQHRHLIDDSFRRDLRCRSLFMEILRQPQGVTRALRRMHRYGVLARYLPAFGPITGRMQHDLFHVYTVDSHTLFVVRNLRRMALPEHRGELPMAHDIMARVPKPELLYLAALFHDIAKGRGGDHSELGASDAYEFCLQHGLGAYDARLVAWLVRHHLELSVTAQRKDLSDPGVITEFARRVGDQAHLDYLYLLTVADIRATNPELWNAWRAALLNELYLLTRAAIRRGLSNPIDKRELIRDTQRDARRTLRQRGYAAGQIRTVWRHLPEEYFLRHSAEEIAWHTEAIAETPLSHLPLVLIAPREAGGGTSAFLYAADSPELFARSVSVLDRLGLSIHDARVITTDAGYTLDSYIVLEQNGAPPTSPGRLEEIRTALAEAACTQGPPPSPVKRHVPRQLQHFQTETQISFSDDPNNQRTIVEVVTADRPGLLARVGQAFSRCGVRLKSAKVATMGERAEDVFFITDETGQPLRRPVQFRCVRQALYELLDEEEANV